jgi:hypothetical protein
MSTMRVNKKIDTFFPEMTDGGQRKAVKSLSQLKMCFKNIGKHSSKQEAENPWGKVCHNLSKCFLPQREMRKVIIDLIFCYKKGSFIGNNSGRLSFFMCLTNKHWKRSNEWTSKRRTSIDFRFNFQWLFHSSLYF